MSQLAAVAASMVCLEGGAEKVSKNLWDSNCEKGSFLLFIEVVWPFLT